MTGAQRRRVVATQPLEGARASWSCAFLDVAPLCSVRSLHPLIDHLCVERPASPGRLSDIISDLEWQELEIADLSRPIWGKNRQLHLGLTPAVRGGDGAAALGAWALTRDGSDYSLHDVELAAAVAPILDVVTRNYPVSRSRPAVVLDLTPREVVVLRLAAHGATSHRVGHVLGVSPRTIDKHLERAYRRLGVTDRVSAIRVATANGLLAESVEASSEAGQLF